jgi:four helix bundle protein
MNYKSLEVYQLADELVINIHVMTLSDLPRFEMYETGSQIRRSVKSVKSNIVEGYGRRNYKADFIHFLVIAMASLDETIDHLETLHRTKSLKDNSKYEFLLANANLLGRKLNTFIESVKRSHLIKPKST